MEKLLEESRMLVEMSANLREQQEALSKRAAKAVELYNLLARRCYLGGGEELCARAKEEGRENVALKLHFLRENKVIEMILQRYRDDLGRRVSPKAEEWR